MENTFKKKYSFEKRLEESRDIIEKYTGRVPIIVEKHHDCTLPTVDKCKYLVPKDMTIMEFMYVVRKRIELKPSQSLFITINNTLTGGNKTIRDIYSDKKDEDGFLYVVYTSENTFG
tara:strand:- start:28413 stop:28763 length:351 start_codon:yes stop_codon:yes gene_type:complete